MKFKVTKKELIEFMDKNYDSGYSYFAGNFLIDELELEGEPVEDIFGDKEHKKCYKNNQTCSGCKPKDIPSDDPLQGPSVTLDKIETLRYVMKYGRKEAIKLMSFDIFQKSWIEKYVDEVLEEVNKK